ncbi:amino acid adenylation domain-containing protein [Streptomyces sp. PT12]|uniref:non-ribosomal peptide synthetase n=1 Tax=Streptomyces sp. PT12 TaxID=1510197 RepID=UPI0015EE7A6D|nr:non-ribosomal peptide synthetase [Streptomyces sp. PT12]
MTPASAKEEALWLLERFVPGTGVNNLSFALAADGPLLPSAVGDALNLLLRRHEVLRTGFTVTESGLVKRVLGPDEASLVLDEAQLSDDARENAGLAAALTAYVREPFAWDGRPLVRASLFRGAGSDVLCVAVHHLVFDMVSAGTMVAELAAAYGAFASGAAPGDELCTIVPAVAEPEPTERGTAFWRARLREFGSVRNALWLGAEAGDHPDLAGGTVLLPLSADAIAAVRRMRKELRAPEAVVLLAAYYLLLARHGAGPDLVVGSPVNTRRPQDAGAIGYHVNVVPLRVRIDPAGDFRALVGAVRDVFLDSLAHADVPVDTLLGEVDRTASGWRNALFRHVFNYVPGGGGSGGDGGEVLLGERRARLLTPENGSSKFDLEFFVIPSDEGVLLRIAHGTGVFTREEVTLLARRYEALLTALAARPGLPVGEVTAWSDVDRRVIAEANRVLEPPPAPVPVLPVAIAARTRETPEAVALEDGERTVCYRELTDAGERTRRLLAAAGVGRGDVVAVLAPRGPELAAAVLGVWGAGAAYLPLDPALPERRIAYQLDDAGARAVLCAPGAAVPAAAEASAHPMVAVGGAPEGRGPATTPSPSLPPSPSPTPSPSPSPDDPAYLIHTSGSTGLPKGTVVTHGNLANLIAHFTDELGASAGGGVLWLTAFSFDISALELFLPLATGGRVVVAPDEARTEGAALAELLKRRAVGTVQATPTTWRLVLPEAGALLAGRNVLCGGEPLPPALAADLVATGCVARNVYGPTETTIWSTSGPLGHRADGRVSVGRPVRDTQVFVADPEGRELPLLVPGELCVAGGGVAAGYHRRPELTEERFGTHPAFGRFYRTGDRARWLPDGTLEVLGRSDRQVKLRGVRVELGEVEAVLAEHPDVRGCAVTVRESGTVDAALVAFVESPLGDAVARPLWEFAAQRLPRACLPQEFVALDRLPVNTSLKVDHPALARMAAARARRAAGEGTAGGERAAGGERGAGQRASGQQTAGQQTASRGRALSPEPGEDARVDTLVALWAEVLGRGDVTPDTHFFAEGGHSLLAVRLAGRIEEETGARVRLPDLFTHATPSAAMTILGDATENADAPDAAEDARNAADASDV